MDWHDFVVVQQIEFTDAEESMVLPPPTSIAVLQSIPLAQRKQMIDVQIAAPVVPMASAGGADAADMDMGE